VIFSSVATMSSLAPPVFVAADDRHVDAMMPVMLASFDPCWGEAWNASQLSSALAMAGSFARRALDAEGRTIGFSLCRGIVLPPGLAQASHARGEVELLLIAVVPVMRGRGLGRALLEQAKTDSRLRAMDEMFLEVRGSNGGAISLYQSAGFFEVGRRRDYYAGVDGTRHDAITMRCLLKS
jgi:ribosomal-protein-alanine N-acetyltransferase